jgi:dolichol-phosphate mannosyltransferase
VSLPRETASYELVFVNDGSSDHTGSILDQLHTVDSSVTVIHLSRNFGHQAAISAGIAHARGAAVIVMDGDLQDPPEVLTDFIATWRRGYDVVYAIRAQRKEPLWKRAAYRLFYRLLRAVSDIPIPLDSGDFCLMDRKVVTALNALPERTRFVRGLRTFVGFKQIGLEYARAARAAGEPKYTLSALVRLAIDGLISFSSYPLRVATYAGIAAAAAALLLTVWVLIDASYNRMTPRGWASTLIIVMFMGGIQLITTGIIGEYIRQIFIESKGRPQYIVGTVRSAASSALETEPVDYLVTGR